MKEASLHKRHTYPADFSAATNSDCGATNPRTGRLSICAKQRPTL